MFNLNKSRAMKKLSFLLMGISMFAFVACGGTEEAVVEETVATEVVAEEEATEEEAVVTEEDAATATEETTQN